MTLADFPGVIRLNECIGDNTLIEKVETIQLAAIACPRSRFYVQVDRVRKHWPNSWQQANDS